MAATGIGIVGTGVIAQYHLRALAQCSDAEVVAVADLRMDVARRTAVEFGIPVVYDDPHKLIADPRVEGVILCFPPAGRAEVGLAAMKARKHVLLEKPVAYNADEVEAYLAARGDLVVGCCSGRVRFTRTARQAREVVASGALGTLRALRCRAVTPAGPVPKQLPPVWRSSREINGGGIMMNWGCYDLDFLLGIMNWSLVPRWVSASTHTAAPQFLSRLPEGADAETHVVALVGFDDDVTLAYERAEFYQGEREQRWEITGTGGTLRPVLTPQPGAMLTHLETPASGDVREHVLWEGPDTWDEVHNGPSHNFVAAIRGGVPMQTSLEASLVIAKITDAVYRSAASGQPVTI